MSETERLRAVIAVLLPVAQIYVLLPVAQIYVDAFHADEQMSLPERLRLQQVEDILADPEHWSPA